MRWRNQLLALCCLLVFLGFGVLYFKYWVVQKPFAIILFIGEGMDPSRLAAARIYAANAQTPLAIDSLPHTALLRNLSRDSATPDQAAANTALATGVQVNNGSLAASDAGTPLPTLLELARDNGRMTGLITSGNLSDAASAAFYAHHPRYDRAAAARDLLNADIDVVLGGGRAILDEQAPNGDARAVLEAAGFDVLETGEELEAVPQWRRARLFGLFADEELAFADEIEHGGEQPTLADMVRRAIELLQYNRGGYLLVVHTGLMRKAALENDGQRTLMETVELDRAVAVALRYAGAKSLIIVCADVGIGGLHLNGTPPRAAGGLELLDESPAAGPWLTWATGPHGPAPPATLQLQLNTFEGGILSLPPAAPPHEEPAAVFSASARYTAGDVPAFATGHGAGALHGTVESTRIFEIIQDNL